MIDFLLYNSENTLHRFPNSRSILNAVQTLNEFLKEFVSNPQHDTMKQCEVSEKKPAQCLSNDMDYFHQEDPPLRGTKA
jgi:hypothetical protein